MLLLIIGLVVFFASHLTRMLMPSIRETGMARIGEGGWKGLYSLVSLVGLVLVVWGWRQFRPDAPIVYDPPAWGRHVTELLVLGAFILCFAAYMPAGRIRTTVQHPFLFAIAAWSIGHLLANGDLASLFLFGSFLVYAIWNFIAVTRRGVPRVQFVSFRGDIGAIAIGVVFTATIALWLHPFIAGVALF